MPEWKQEILKRLATLRLAPAREAEIAEELAQHLEDRFHELLARGASETEARRQSLAELSDERILARELRRVVHTMTHETLVLWTTEKKNIMEDLGQDLRYGMRMLAKNPGFTIVAVLTLALGIGANSAIFSLVNGVLLRPLPYRDPGRLTVVWELDDQGHPNNATYATYTDWKSMNKSFEELALYSSWQPTLTGANDPETINGLRVTNNYFRTLGVRPELGRDFRPEEDNPSSNRVVILSHELWQRDFNSDAGIVGKTITLNALSYVVAGVMPADFQSLMSMDPRGGPVEIWRVLGYDASLPWACRTCHHLIAIGRLKAGVTYAQTKAELDTITAALWKAYPKDYSAAGVMLTPIREQLLGPVSTTLYLFMGAVAFVLLVACVNLANLLLARAARREKEMAVRVALGASRGRVLRQMLTENCLLALLAATVGLKPVLWTPALLATLGAGDLPRLAEVRLDGRVLLFTLGLALMTGLLSALASAPRASITKLHDALNESARGSSAGTGLRLRGLLVVSEIALSLTLLVGAGLLLRSLVRVLNVSPGFDADRVLTMRISLLGSRYDDNRNVRQYFAQAVERVRTLPGVKAAGVVSEIPLGGSMDRYGFHAEGKVNANPELDPSAERYCVSPGYRSAMRIRLLRGRDLAESDTADAPQVILINESAARQIWLGEVPLGKRVKLGGIDQPWWTVVGVVGDVHQSGLDIAPNMQFYVPHAQWPFPDTNMTFAIKTAGPPGEIASAARQAIRSLDSNQPISRVLQLEDNVGLSVQVRRFSLILVGAFAATALLLSVVGIYGVTSFTVAQRTREIGIRRALGAEPGEIVALLLKQGLLLILGGVALGAATALALTRLMASLLFGVSAADPMTFAGVAILLVTVALAACYVPARRASRVDPMVALRYE